MGDDVGLCHMCYQWEAGRSEEELSVEQEQFSETASDGNFVNTVGEGTLPHSRWAVAIPYAVITEADANNSDTSKVAPMVVLRWFGLLEPGFNGARVRRRRLDLRGAQAP